MEHKCHKKISSFVSSKYLNSALNCTYFNDNNSYKTCNFCSLLFSNHSKEKVEVKSELNNFKIKSVEDTLLTHLDKEIESNTRYLTKSYQNFKYKN